MIYCQLTHRRARNHTTGIDNVEEGRMEKWEFVESQEGHGTRLKHDIVKKENECVKRVSPYGT